MSKRTVVLVLAAVMVLIVFGVVRAQEQEYALDTPALTATEVNGEIELIWTEVERATRYDLQVWDCVNEWRPISENVLRTTEAVHTDPADGITYLYTVQALNDRGEESDWAAISKNGDNYDFIRETVNPIPSPDFDIVAQADHIQLRYSNVEEAVGYQARVWYPGAGDDWIWLPEENLDLDSRTFSYSDVSPGVDYFFVMRAYSEDKCGFSDWSAYRLHTFAGGGTTGGGTGGGTTGNPDGGTTGGGGTGGGGTTGGGTTGGGTTDGGTTGGGTTGGGTTGVTGPANTATPTATATSTGTPTATATPVLAPGPISWDSHSSTHNSIEISWHAPDPNAEQYRLRRQTGNPGSFGPPFTFYSTDTSESFSGLAANTTYTFWVQGINGNLDGPWTLSRTVRTTVNPSQLAQYVPDRPTNLTATNDVFEGGVSLRWRAGTGSPPSDCSCPLHGYEVQRRLASPGARWHTIVTTGRNSRYVDDDAIAGVSYRYQVRAVNKHGLSQPSNSATGSYTPPTPTPVPTTDTTDTRTQCEIDGVTCPAPNTPCIALENDESACGCPCSVITCGVVYLYSLGDASHHRLHEMMAYDEVIGVLYGIEWIETQLENAIVLRTHPYYALNEQHALHEHFRALHDQNEHHKKQR